jgi:ABC-type branched-subunit amino acid transport system ATPase component
LLEPNGSILQVNDLVRGYGRKLVIDGIEIGVSAGDVVAIIGHNGAGKSTLLKAVFGLLPIWSGRILFFGEELPCATPRELLRRGVAYVPQGNRVFPGLSVQENLLVGSYAREKGGVALDAVHSMFTLFPALKQSLSQKAGSLSGGEKQMLALATALVSAPRLILLDEPSLGLSPSLVPPTLRRIGQICRELGTAALIVEQKVREVLKVATRVYVLRNGRVSFSGSAEDLGDDEVKLRQAYI